MEHIYSGALGLVWQFSVNGIEEQFGRHWIVRQLICHMDNMMEDTFLEWSQAVDESFN